MEYEVGDKVRIKGPWVGSAWIPQKKLLIGKVAKITGKVPTMHGQGYHLNISSYSYCWLDCELTRAVDNHRDD